MATNSQEQSHVAENQNVFRISDISQENVSAAKEMVEDIGKINQMTQNAKEMVSQFK